MRVVGNIEINRPAAEVFAYVSDQLNGPEWQQGLEEVHRTTGDAIGTGTRHTFQRRVGRRQVSGENVYVEFEQSRRILFTFKSSDGLTGEGWYEVTPLAPDRTRLDSGVEIQLRGLIRLTSPLIERSIREEDRQDTERLKGILEKANTKTSGAL